MRKTGFFILCIGLSFVLHFFFVLLVKVEIDAKKTPVIYGWPNILDKKDLLISGTQVDSLPEFVFALDEVRRDYFSHHLFGGLGQKSVLHENLDVFEPLKNKIDVNQKDRPRNLETKYFYLWEQVAGLPSQETEAVTYNIFVSSQGKVLLIYPDKLAVNSSGNLLVQDHLRSASFFMNDNFFWTKMERIVK
jgi:hypothetical protein